MIKRIREIFSNRSARTLINNFFSLSSMQLVGMLLPLVTLPYILRVLGFEKYGIIVLASSLVAYFQSVTDFSFKITATRDVAKFRGNPRKLNLIYSRVLTVKLILLLFSFSIITTVVFLYAPFWDDRLIFFLSMPLLLGHALFPDWFFQGIEKMKYISFLDIGIKLFFTCCIFIFVKKPGDFWIYPLLYSGSYIMAGFIGQLILVRNFNLRFIWLKQARIKNVLLDNYPVFVNQFVPTLYNNSTTFLLGIFGTSIMVGNYAAIKRIVDLAVRLLSIVSRVFFPLLNRNRDAFVRYRQLVLSVSIALCLLILLSSKLIFWYLNIDYSNAVYVLLVLVIGIIGYSVYDIYGLNYFIVRREDKLVMSNTLKVSFAGFLLAFPLVYYFGILGAAINLSLARILLGGGIYYKYHFRKLNPLKSIKV
ncbi:oligosaccharide flippase family protein [Gramella lutea]|uniref:Oligosaccharide flippase family protein n=1 Tax=Christiangramia lutea TaxID=1607951 RepID=A0A9X2A9E1_9FLAO|nr:oligosaccharide flippase family protein [Christiangramia lutea]MCH4821981.1 oligosaccharide flippase family protein [Christiangramia lutea]